MRKVLVVALAIGCGGGHGGGLSLGDLPNAFLDALCQHEVNCGEFPDLDTCRRGNNAIHINTDPSVPAAVSAGKVIYNAGKARECVDAIASMTCDTTDGDERTFFPIPCFETSAGTLHAGDTCALGIECISGTCDVPSCPDACCMGTCTGDTPPAFNLPIGAMCSSQLISSECEAAAFCDSTTHMCTALKPDGATCNNGNECDFGLGCAGSPKICKALPTLGEACPDNQCRDEGTVCLGTCVKVGLAGDPCAADAACSTFYRCDTAMGKCAEGPGLGDPCTFSGECWDHAFCDVPNGQTMGTCAPAEADGQPCNNNSDCASDNCNASNVCETKGVCI
jgi:hypothetical protein